MDSATDPKDGGASWFAWYLLMGMNWIRYLFPPFFIGSIFATEYISRITSGFDFRLLVRRISSILLCREFNIVNLQSILLLLAISVTLGTVIVNLNTGLSVSQLYDPEQASAYLSSNLPIGAIVETFESELFFLAPELVYHFPSDLVSMQAQRKTAMDPMYPIEYALPEDLPDYLVIGPMGNIWPIYEPFLNRGDYSLTARIGNYSIYNKSDNP
jgi:hypothetical protein